MNYFTTDCINYFFFRKKSPNFFCLNPRTRSPESWRVCQITWSECRKNRRRFTTCSLQGRNIFFLHFFKFEFSRQLAESSPYFEIIKSKNREVLFIYDPADEVIFQEFKKMEKKKHCLRYFPISLHFLSLFEMKIIYNFLKGYSFKAFWSVFISRKIRNSDTLSSAYF